MLSREKNKIKKVYKEELRRKGQKKNHEYNNRD